MPDSALVRNSVTVTIDDEGAVLITLEGVPIVAVALGPLVDEDSDPDGLAGGLPIDVFRIAIRTGGGRYRALRGGDVYVHLPDVAA